MGSSSWGKSLDIKLQIRYHGLKATQYFSKFTPESEQVFRRDLTALKLPHPKKINVTFVSYGYVECIWPEVVSGATLHKSLVHRTSPPTPDLQDALRQTLGELSIVKLGLKEISHETPHGNPHSHSAQDRIVGVPFPIKKRPYQDFSATTTTTTDSHFGENPDSESSRPFKIPRLEPRTYFNLPPNSTLQSQRKQLPVYPINGPGQLNAGKLPGPSPSTSTGSLADYLLSSLGMSNGYTSTPKRPLPKRPVNRFRRGVAEVARHPHDPSLSSSPVPSTSLLPPKPASNAQPSTSTSNPTERGKRPMDGAAMTRRLLGINPVSLSADNYTSGVWTTRWESASASLLPQGNDVNTPMGSGRTPDARGPIEHNENATDAHPPLSSFPPPAAAATAQNNDTTPRIKEEEVIDNLESDMAKRKNVNNLRTQPNEHTEEIQRLTRESWDVKRQLTDAIHREKVIISELKKYGSDWIPEPTIIGERVSEDESNLRERLAQLEVERTLTRVQANKDAKNRLAELEAQLKQERKLREQAENVIADIRRECKAPFVVPSLLDAFRQISELSTRAMEPL